MLDYRVLDISPRSVWKWEGAEKRSKIKVLYFYLTKIFKVLSQMFAKIGINVINESKILGSSELLIHPTSLCY